MRLFLVISVLFVFAGSASGQSSGPPTYAVGDTWKRNVDGNVREVKVVKVDDGGTWVTGDRTDCPTCLSYRDRDLTLTKITDVDGKDVDVTRMRFVQLGREWRFFDFPLEVNKAWRISAQAYVRGSLEKYDVDCKVVGYEDVKTAAGTFKAFRIRYDWTWRSKMAGTYDVRWYTEFWFAPDAKNVVKITSSGRGTEQWELVSYSLK